MPTETEKPTRPTVQPSASVRRFAGRDVRVFRNTPLAFVEGGLPSVIEHQRAGISAQVVGVMSKKLELSTDGLLSALKLPRSTLKSRQASGRNLSPKEAERMVRVARIYVRATEVFGDEDDARNWLKQPLRTLGGKPPLSFLDLDTGYELVEDELKRIEYGVVA